MPDESAPVPPDRFPLLAAAAALILLLAYANSFHNSFHFDDSHVIENNRYIRSLSNIPDFFTDARTFSSIPANSTYRPLLSVTYALDYKLGHRLDPFQFHLTQFILLVVLGGALTALFSALMDQTLPDDQANSGDARPSIGMPGHRTNRYAALFAATFFCIHTANTETMNFLSSRSDLLSTLFVVIAFLAAMSPRLRRWQLHLVAVILGALVKAPAVFFAPLYFVWLYLSDESGRSRPAKLKDAGRTSASSWVTAVVMLWFLNRMNASTWTPGAVDRAGYLRTQFWIFLHYLRLFVLPIGLTADTDQETIAHWYDTRLIAGAIALSAILLLIGWAARRRERRPIAFGLAWFVIALLPTSLFPLAEVANEHRIFFPYIGLALAVTWAAVLGIRHLRTLPDARPAMIDRGVVACVALILLAHGIGTHERNQAWRTEESLWRDVTEKSPRNGRGQMNYGLTQMSQGKYDVARRYFEAAQPLTPNYSTLEINIGIVEGATGHQALAEQHFLRALTLSPDASSHFFYGRWLIAQGRTAEAASQLQAAVTLSPAWLDPRELLSSLGAAPVASAAPISGQTYDELFRAGFQKTQQGDDLDAIRLDRAALQIAPNSPEVLNNLGFSLARLGRFNEALPPLERAVALRPGFELARNNLAWVRGELEKTAPKGP